MTEFFIQKMFEIEVATGPLEGNAIMGRTEGWD